MTPGGPTLERRDRRDFLRNSAVGVVGGWFGINAAKAHAAAEAAGLDMTPPAILPSLKERDETWTVDGKPQAIHVIEMAVPYDHPTIVFQKENGRRFLVARTGQEELRRMMGANARATARQGGNITLSDKPLDYSLTPEMIEEMNNPPLPPLKPGEWTQILQERLAQVLKAFKTSLERSASRKFKVIEDEQVVGTVGGGVQKGVKAEAQPELFALYLEAKTPTETQYGLAAASEDVFQAQHMQLTVPAPILFGEPK